MADDLNVPEPQPVGGSPVLKPAETAIQRTVPEQPAGVVALIKEAQEKIKEAKVYWGPTFKKMRDDSKFARGKQWPGQTEEDDRYRANITLRHINQRVANIYAKNPKVRALRRKKLYSTVWDGTPEMLALAVQTIAQAATAAAPAVPALGAPPGANPAAAAAALGAPASAAAPAAALAPAQPPAPAPTGMDPETAKTIIQEYSNAQSQRRLYQRMGQTLELVAQYSLDEPIPKFKPQAKQLVRRVLTTGCGFLKLGYQRTMKFDSADVDARIKDATDKMAVIETLLADLHDKEIDESSARAAELKDLISQLQKDKEVVLREGLVFSFPKSWSIIIDPAVTQLKGFVGAEWVAEEFIFTPMQVKKFFKIDVGQQYDQHTATGAKADKRYKNQKFCAVYVIYDLSGRQCFTICSGYPGYLRAPGEPDVDLEQFHPFYTLSFNDIEPDADEDSVYPPSDVEQMRSMQMEYNRGREGLRVHRQANRPAYLSARGVLDDATKAKLGNHADHELIETNLSKQDDINKVIQKKPTAEIDQKLYDVEPQFQDTQRVVGDQAANLGGTSGSTATETSIAENTRTTSIQSNIDDLDEFLTDVMRGAGQILLTEMGLPMVQEIAGPGAVWPEHTRADVVKEMCLEIRAGSSGKPNKQARLQAIEKTAPYLLQIPGIKGEKLGEFMLNEIDEGIEIEDFMQEGLPSIVAQNAMAGPNRAPMAGNVAQGPQGANNAQHPGGTGAEEQNMHPGPGGSDQPPLLTAR